MSSTGRTRRSERIFKRTGLSKFKNTSSTPVVIEDVVDDVFEEESPVIGAQADVFEEQSTIPVVTQDVVNEQTPVIGAQEDVFEEESPVIGAQANVFEEQSTIPVVTQDVVNEQTPVTGVQSPVIGAQEDVFEEESPVIGAQTDVFEEQSTIHVVTQDVVNAEEQPHMFEGPSYVYDTTITESEKDKTTQGMRKKYTRSKILEEIRTSSLCRSVIKPDNLSKGKEVVSKRKSVCVGDVDDSVLVKVSKQKNFLAIRTRMSPHSLFIALKNLSLEQKICLKEMGFGGLYKMPCDGLPGHIGHFVVNNFNPRNMTLKLKNGVININEGAVHEILGIPCRGLNICDLNELPMEDRPLISQWYSQFRSGNKVRATDICKAIVNSSEAGILFKINFLVLFSNTMVGCPSSGFCDLKLLKFFDESVDISALNWCRYILDSLAKSKSGWDKYGSRLYGGPLTFLVLLYFDYVKFHLDDTPRGRPAIQGWSMDKMKARQDLEMKEGGFGIWNLQPDYNQLIMNEDFAVDDIVRKLQSKFSVLLDDKDDIMSYLQEAVHKFPLHPKILDFKELFKSVFVCDDDDIEDAVQGGV